MSIEIMSNAWKKSRQSGARLLALLALADRADEDGVCWPGRDWIAERARVRKDNLRRIIRALEEAGEIVYDPGRGRGRRTYYLVAIALTPEEMKEIAMRRFQMSEEDATAFVAEIVNRQLQNQLKNTQANALSVAAKEKGSRQTPFNEKGVPGAPFSKKGSRQTPFQNKKGVPGAREKGSLEPAKRGPYGPPDTSIDTSIDPSETITTLESHNIQQQQHAHARTREEIAAAAEQALPSGEFASDITIAQKHLPPTDFTLNDAFHLVGIKNPTAQRIPAAWAQATGRKLTPVDVLAWHFQREAENTGRPPERRLGVAVIIHFLEAGEPADERFYDQAREFLLNYDAEAADFAPAPPTSPEEQAARQLADALQPFLPRLPDVGMDAFDQARARLPDIARELVSRGISADEVRDLHLYLAYTGQPLPQPEMVAAGLADAGEAFRAWRMRRREALQLWRRILQAGLAPPGSAVARAMQQATPVDLNGALVVMMEPGFEAYFTRIWQRQSAHILSQAGQPLDLPIQFLRPQKSR